MIKKLLIVIISTLCLVACKEEQQTELPFEEEKVIAILADMHFAKSAVLIQNQEKRDSMKEIFETQVLTIHGISKREYNELKFVLESDLKLYYEIEKKVHKHLKGLQNEKS